jgi:hypothetical protein
MPICKDWLKTSQEAEKVSFGISKAIVITNTLIRFFIIWIFSYVGSKTETMLAYHITIGIFFCVNLNTGWLPLLSNANLRS